MVFVVLASVVILIIVCCCYFRSKKNKTSLKISTPQLDSPRLQPTLNASTPPPSQQASYQNKTLGEEKGPLCANDHIANANNVGGSSPPPAATYQPPLSEEENVDGEAYQLI